MGKKTPLYSGGNNPTVTPKTAPQRAVLPQEATVLPLRAAVLPLHQAVLPCSLKGRRERERAGGDLVRYCRGGWAVLPLVSGTAALLPP